MTGASDLRHPDSPYDVVPYRADEPLDLPDGDGVLAVHTSCPRGARRPTLAPMVGVDGRPAVYGWVTPRYSSPPPRTSSRSSTPGRWPAGR